MSCRAGSPRLRSPSRTRRPSILKVKGEEEDEDTRLSGTYSGVDARRLTTTSTPRRRLSFDASSGRSSTGLSGNAGCEGSGRRGAPPALPGIEGDGGKGGKKRKEYRSAAPRAACGLSSRRFLEDQLRRAERSVQAGRVERSREEEKQEDQSEGGRGVGRLRRSSRSATAREGARGSGAANAAWAPGGREGPEGRRARVPLAAGATLASGGDAAGAAGTANPAVGSKFDSIAAAVDIRPKQTARKSRGLSAATLAMAGKRKGGKRDADATK